MSHSDAGRLSWPVVLAALLVALVPAVLWPGDAPWFWDEPLELKVALDANQQHELAEKGLFGGFPFPYGPLGIQVMQLGLLFTHDLRVLVVYHAVLCAVGTALALLWLARTLRLPAWFAVAVLAAPHLWFEARRLWQPSFCIPLGALALAAYASFLSTGRRRSLVLAVACALAPLFIHLQSLPLSLAILGHMLLRRRAELWRARWAILPVLVVLAVLNLRYLFIATWCLIHLVPQSLAAGHNSGTPFRDAWWTPVLAGNLFGGWDWIAGATVWARLARIVSSISVPLVWIGIALAGWSLRWHREPGARVWDKTPHRTILAIALAGLALQFLLCAALRLSAKHHYYFGTFGLHVLFAWVAVAAVPRPAWRGLLIAAYGLSVSFITVTWIAHVHRHSWQWWFAPTLNEQIELVKALNAYSDRWAYTEVPVYRERPEVLGNLRLLYPPDPSQPQRFSGNLFIGFTRDANGTVTGLTLSEPEGLFPDAWRIALDVTKPP